MILFQGTENRVFILDAYGNEARNVLCQVSNSVLKFIFTVNYFYCITQ